MTVPAPGEGCIHCNPSLHREGVDPCCLDAHDRMEVMEAERDRMRAWLREYGYHMPSCSTMGITVSSWHGASVTSPTCTCGLDELLGLVRGRKAEAEP